MKKPVMLMILDGYGLRENPYGNAVEQANAPRLKALLETYPHTTLKTSGEAVGLPEGQMGNSEVGHLNIGAGRIVYQDLTRISKTIEDGTFFKNEELSQIMERVKEREGTLHLFGLVSDGGVHSHLDHLKALLKMAVERGIEDVQVACFLDGRDVPPRSALTYLNELKRYMDLLKIGTISLISGRYYAMDRDRRWERVSLCYDALTLNEGIFADSYEEAVKMAYERGEDDEFVKPTIIKGAEPVMDEDGIIFFNFRPDRARELTRCFVDSEFTGFERRRIFENPDFVTLCEYDVTMPLVKVAFMPVTIVNTLGECVSNKGLSQLRIAETEKYAHVTFFFNGGIEKPYLLEDRVLIPSPKVKTYDLKPEMSAYLVTERVLLELSEDKYFFIVLNFANADMVGHSGNLEAAIKAIEALENCVPQIIEKVLSLDGQVLLTADHGNAEQMLEEDGSPVTAHSKNPVPLVHIAKNPRHLRGEGLLCDIAPMILELLDIEKPVEMTGRSLFMD